MLDGAARFKDAVAAAAADGQPALAITDHGVLYGVVDFVKEAKAAGIKPIIGMEAYLTEGSRFDRPVGNANRRFHMNLIAENETAVKALAKSYFDALQMIKLDQSKSYEIMGADVKQSGEQFGNSAKYLRWQDSDANKTFFAGEFATFNREAANLLLETGVIRQIPDLSKLADTRFVR